MVSISVPSYAQTALDTMSAARAASLEVIAIIDAPVSQITQDAANVPGVDDAALHGFRSLVGVMSRVQTLAICLAYRLCHAVDLDKINA